MFYFRNLFKLRGLEHKITKLATKEIQETQDMLNKLYPFRRYKTNSGKNLKKMFDTFQPLC